MLLWFVSLPSLSKIVGVCNVDLGDALLQVRPVLRLVAIRYEVECCGLGNLHLDGTLSFGVLLDELHNRRGLHNVACVLGDGLQMTHVERGDLSRDACVF